MTSVTVAGGSFDVPRAAAEKAPRPGRERWLRYGIGVSIAAILATDAVILASALLEDGAPQPARRGAAAASSSTPASSGGTVTGDGFASFHVPADLEAFAAGASTPLSFSPVASPAGDGAGPATTASPALTMPSVPAITAPRTTTGPGFGPSTSGPGTGSENTNPPAQPSMTASLVETVTDVVATVPQVGPTAAPVVETVTEPVVTAVAPAEETAVEQVAPASTSTVTSPVPQASVSTAGLL